MEILKPEDIVTEEILSDALGGVEVISYKSEPAVAKGEHYLSTLLRIHVTFREKGNDTEENTKIIAKTYPDGILQVFSKESQLLVRELICYQKIIPQLNKILGRKLTPVQLGPNRSDVLILEDLKLKGFTMANRLEKMDFRHCAASLKILADLHASSIMAYNEDPKLFDELKNEVLFADSNVIQRTFCLNGFRILAEEFEKVPHLQHYCDRLRSAGERIWKAVVEAVKSRDDEINVLNHGDFWTTNILFHYDDKNDIDDLKLIDFQFSRWTSPAMDLIMFYNTSVRNRDDIPKLTKVYLDSLNGHFDKIILSAENLESSLKRFHSYGLFIAVSTMPICTLDPKDALNFDGVDKDDYLGDFKDTLNPYQVACRDKRFQEVIPEFLDFYIEIGLL